MFEHPNLSDEQIDEFARQGYLVVRGALGPEAMQRVRELTAELLALPEAPGRHHLFREPSLIDPDEKLVSRIEYISPFVPGFAELAECLKRPVEQLLDESAILFKEKINFKLAGADGFKPHQDSQAGWDRYADYFINAALTIDSCTLENGCLELVAGHHHRGLFKSWEPIPDAHLAEMDFEPVPTEPGDVVLFDCFTPHRSEPNLTSTQRRVYFSTYNRSSAGDHLEQYYADKRKSYPPDIEREAGKDYVFRV